MCGTDVTARNKSEMDALEIQQYRVPRVTLNAPKYKSVETLRGDVGWSTFRKDFKNFKVTLGYKLERWMMHENDGRSGLQVIWVLRMAGKKSNLGCVLVVISLLPLHKILS